MSNFNILQISRRDRFVAIAAAAFFLVVIPLVVLGNALSGGDAKAGVLEPGSTACADVSTWYDASQARLKAVDMTVLSDADPSTFRTVAGQVEDVADEQGKTDVPKAAEEANDVWIAGLDAFADAFNTYADTLDAGETPDEDEIFAALEPLDADFTARVAELSAACGIDLETA